MRTDKIKGRPIDLSPESLEIGREELKFMKELAALVGRSPRALKRYINLYRLIKATLEQTKDPVLIDAARPKSEKVVAASTPAAGPNISDHQAVLFLLAVVTGLPDVSRRFFEAIHDGLKGDPAKKTLAAALEMMQQDEICAAASDCERLSDWLAAYQKGAWGKAHLGYFADRAAQVARYSFRVEQRAGTQKDTEEELKDTDSKAE